MKLIIYDSIVPNSQYMSTQKRFFFKRIAFFFKSTIYIKLELIHLLCCYGVAMLNRAQFSKLLKGGKNMYHSKGKRGMAKKKTKKTKKVKTAKKGK